MSTKKQTARKTTGNHYAITSALASTSKPRAKKRQSATVLVEKKRKFSRVIPTLVSSGMNGSHSKPSAHGVASSIHKHPTENDPLPPPVPSVLFWDSLDLTVSEPEPGGPPAGENGSEAGTVVRRRPLVGVLDVPISVCTRFATWLEKQTCVHDDALLRAVERDGSHLLSLARATVTFDQALRGRVSPPAAMNGVSGAGPLHEYAHTLRAFADLLKLKISEGSLSDDLESAVLRDGEALLRLALSCLEFDKVVQGLDAAAS